MTLPSYINANNPPTGNGYPSGIIYSVRQKVGYDNIASYVIPTENRPLSNSEYDIKELVKWNGQYSSSCSMDAYIQFEFKDRYVYPTYYSLKGRKDWYYTKEWYLYGFNEVGEEKTLISENTSVGSTFCAGGSTCASYDWGTFQIIKPVQPFRYFMLTIKTPSAISSPYNNFCGFEIFGVYSSNKATLSSKKKTYCFVSYPLRSRLPAYAFLRLFMVYLK